MRIIEFIENYLIDHHLKSRSDVIKEALYLLQQKQLEMYYREANQKIDLAYDSTSPDGLDHSQNRIQIHCQ